MRMTEIPQMPRKPDHLAEGVYVPAGGGAYAHMVVLRDLGADRRHHRFVVHDYVMPDDGNPSSYTTGDYCDTLEEAMRAFRDRNERNRRYVEARASTQP